MNPSLQFSEPVRLAPLREKESLANICTCAGAEVTLTVRELKMRHGAATKIQALFKTFFLKCYLKVHDQNHPHHMIIFETLKNIYTSLFSVANRIEICSNIIQQLFVYTPEVAAVLPSCNAINDLRLVMHLKEFTGYIEVDPKTWFPICRYIFYILSSSVMNVRIYLATDNPSFKVRVFNNDTLEEMYRFSNKTDYGEYASNILGYTVFCYGWNDEAIPKTVRWKLCFITPKETHGAALYVPAADTTTDIFYENYRPNVDNRIFSTLVSAKETGYASFHLHTSCPTAKLLLRYSTLENQVVAEVEAVGSVVLPLVKLELPCDYEELLEKRQSAWANSTMSIIRPMSNRLLSSKALGN